MPVFKIILVVNIMNRSELLLNKTHEYKVFNEEFFKLLNKSKFIFLLDNYINSHEPTNTFLKSLLVSARKYGQLSDKQLNGIKKNILGNNRLGREDRHDLIDELGILQILKGTNSEKSKISPQDAIFLATANMILKSALPDNYAKAVLSSVKKNASLTNRQKNAIKVGIMKDFKAKLDERTSKNLGIDLNNIPQVISRPDATSNMSSDDIRMRQLKVLDRFVLDNPSLDFMQSVYKQAKNGKILTPGQTAVIKKILKKNKYDSSDIDIFN